MGDTEFVTWLLYVKAHGLTSPDCGSSFVAMAAENLPQIRFYANARSASRRHSHLLPAANDLEGRPGDDGCVRNFATAA